MKAALRLTAVFAALLALIALPGCGGRKHSRMAALPGAATTHEQTPVSLDDTIAQLDALARPDGVDEKLWADLTSALRTALTANSHDGKLTSKPPTGDANRVNDLAISDNGDGTYQLSWHYRNLGDYNQDGVVGVDDLALVALHYGEHGNIFDDNILTEVIDGSGDHRIDVADITAIAQHFGEEIKGYIVESSDSFDAGWAYLSEISQNEGTGEGRLGYSLILDTAPYNWYKLTAIDSSGVRAYVVATLPNPFISSSASPSIKSISPLSCVTGTARSFVANVEGAEPFSYEWSFGNAATPSTSSDPEPVVTIGVEGNYPCSLRVSNAFGSDTLSFLLVVSSGGNAWRMEGCDAQHTHRSTAIGPSEPAIKWKLPAYHPSGEFVFSASGDAFVETWSDAITCISPWGEVLWQIPVNDAITFTPAVSIEGSVYAADNSFGRNLSSYSSEGVFEWNYISTYSRWPYWGSPVLGDDGTIYSIAELVDSAELCALNPDGSLRWDYYFIVEGMHGVSSPALGPDGTVYVAVFSNSAGENVGYLYALDSQGQFKWRFDVGSQMSDGLAVGEDGAVYFGSANTYFYAVNPDGSERWRFQTGDRIWKPPAIASDGTVLFSSMDGSLYALTPEGSLRWYYELYGWPSAPIIDALGNVYVDSSGGSIFSFTMNGDLRWEYKVSDFGSNGSGLSLSPAGDLYIGSTYDYFIVLTEASSQPVISGVAPAEGYTGMNAQLTAKLSGPVADIYSWDFGGGAEPNISSDPSPTVTLNDPGEYSASVTVSNAAGEASFPFTMTVRAIPHEPWVHTWSATNQDVATDIDVDDWGSVWMVGANRSPLHIAKYDIDGGLLSSSSWNVGASGPDPYAVEVASDGSVFVTVTDSSGIALLKFNSSAEPEWNKVWTNYGDEARSLSIDLDGNVYISGVTYVDVARWWSDIIFLKYNADGDLLATRALTMDLWQEPKAATLGSNGNLFIAGMDVGAGYKRALVASLSEDGQFAWGRYYQKVSDATAIAADGQGTLYITGEISFDDFYGPLIMKMDEEGNLLWAKTLFSPGGGCNIIGVVCDEAGNILLTGAISTQVGMWSYGLLLVALSPDGNVLYSKKWLPFVSDSQFSYGASIQVANDDVYIAGATTGLRGSWQNILTFALPSSLSLTEFSCTAYPVSGDESSLDLAEVSDPVRMDEGADGNEAMLLMKNFPP